MRLISLVSDVGNLAMHHVIKNNQDLDMFTYEFGTIVAEVILILFAD